MVFVGIIVLGLFLFVPGFLALRWAGIPWLLALAASPAWVGLAASGLGVIFDLLGIRWNALSFLAGLIILCLLWVVVVSLLRRKFCFWWPPLGSQQWSNHNWSRQQGQTPKAEVITSVLIALVGLVLPIAVLLASGMLNYAAQGHDAIFHLNGAWYVRETGNANIFSSMSRLYGVAYTDNAYYPAIWHALVALAPAAVSIVQATNALMVLTSWIWIVSLAALAKFSLQRVQYSLPLTLAFSLLFTVFPAYLLNRRLWPNALELAMLPAVIAVLYWVWGRLKREQGSERAILLLVAAIVALGAGVVYPASLVALAFILLPAYVYALVKLVKWMKRRLRKRQFVGAMALSCLILGLAVCVALSSNQIMGRLSASITRAGSAYFNKLLSLFVYWPRDGVTTLEFLGLGAFALLTMLGLVLTCKYRRWWWISAFWVMSALLLVGSLFYVPGLSHLTLLFYSATWRLVPIELIFALLLAAMATSWLLRLVAKGLRKIRGQIRGDLLSKRFSILFIGVLAIYCVIAPFPSRVSAEITSRMPDQSEDTYMYDQAELEMIESLADLIDDDKLLIGDQLSGAAMVQVISDIPVLVAHGTIDSTDWVGEYLSKNFDKLGEDPIVCSLIREYNIGYFYEDEPIITNGRWRDQETPAYYRVDTEKLGFELVAQGGSAKVWRITGCELE